MPVPLQAELEQRRVTSWTFVIGVYLAYCVWAVFANYAAFKLGWTQTLSEATSGLIGGTLQVNLLNLAIFLPVLWYHRLNTIKSSGIFVMSSTSYSSLMR